MVYAPPKVGKSFACMAMGQAIATGAPNWLGFEIEKHGPVAYLQADTPRGEWAFRYEQMKAAGMDMSNQYVADQLLFPKFPFSILDPDCFAALRKFCDDVQPVVVFIDTIREINDADENDSTQMRNVLTQLIAACRPAAVVILGHARKENAMSAVQGANLMSDLRGSSYINGRMDVIIRMWAKNKQTSGLEYHGRSRGSGRIAVCQNQETGLLELDGADALWWQTIKDVVGSHVATGTVPSTRSMANEVLERNSHKKLRACQDDIDAYLVELGVKPPKKKGVQKPAAQTSKLVTPSELNDLDDSD